MVGLPYTCSMALDAVIPRVVGQEEQQNRSQTIQGFKERRHKEVIKPDCTTPSAQDRAAP